MFILIRPLNIHKNLNLNRMSDFYIVITTMRSYIEALKVLLQSIPEIYKNRCIYIYSKEPTNDYKLNEDGNIEVSIRNNIYEYGAFLGINMLLEKKVIPETSIFLFIHDTCKFGPQAGPKIEAAYESFKNVSEEIYWLSLLGRSNICLIKPRAIQEGAKRFKNHFLMDKMLAIDAEWNKNSISPKRLPVKQKYHKETALETETQYVYNKEVERHVIYFSIIDMEKFFVLVTKTVDHPQKP